MQLKKINKILKREKSFFKKLENYDLGEALPKTRKRIDITLSVETIKKLNELKKKTGKPISQIIESKFIQK